MQVINCWNIISDFLEFEDQINITKVNKFMKDVKITNMYNCSLNIKKND